MAESGSKNGDRAREHKIDIAQNYTKLQKGDQGEQGETYEEEIFPP